MTERFNKLTATEDELYSMLAEEAGEVVVEVMKIKRHGELGYHPDQPSLNNLQRLENEIVEMLSVYQKLGGVVHFEQDDLDEAFRKKMHWMHHS